MHTPKNQSLALIKIYCLIPTIFSILFYSWLNKNFSLTELLGVAFFYIGALGCYLILYTAVEETSPSLAIFWALQKNSTIGCTREQLSSVITDDNFIKPRIEALKRDGILEQITDLPIQKLTPKGRKAAKVTIFIAKVFNIQRNA
jgi:hypothetical protein